MPPPGSLPPGVAPPQAGFTAPPPGIDAQEEAKRAKAEAELVPEAQWSAQHPNPISVKVIVPQEEENAKFNLNGQTVMLNDLLPATTVKDLKTQLSDQLGGLQANKIKLSTVKHGFLKDNLSIAHYNFVEGENLMVSTKERGGRSAK